MHILHEQVTKEEIPESRDLNESTPFGHVGLCFRLPCGSHHPGSREMIRFVSYNLGLINLKPSGLLITINI